MIYREIHRQGSDNFRNYFVPFSITESDQEITEGTGFIKYMFTGEVSKTQKNPQVDIPIISVNEKITITNLIDHIKESFNKLAKQKKCVAFFKGQESSHSIMGETVYPVFLKNKIIN